MFSLAARVARQRQVGTVGAPVEGARFAIRQRQLLAVEAALQTFESVELHWPTAR